MSSRLIRSAGITLRCKRLVKICTRRLRGNHRKRKVVKPAA